MRGARGVLVAFAAGALALLVALGWGSAELLRQEARRQRAQQAQLRGEQLRLAVWRVESLIAPVLAQEALRPHFHYQAFYNPSAVFSSDWRALPGQRVRVPSPLLRPASEWLTLHFQIDATGAWSSPQVPQGPALIACMSLDDAPVPASSVGASGRALAALQGPDGAARAAALRRLLDEAADARGDRFVAVRTEPPAASPAPPVVTRQNHKPPTQKASELYTTDANTGYTKGSRRGRAEWDARNRSMARNINNTVWTNDAPTPAPLPVTQSTLVPRWVDGGRQLLFVRRVDIGDDGRERLVQGFAIDWPRLEVLIRAEIADLFPRARTRRRGIDASSAPPSLRAPGASIDGALTAVPVFLEPGEPLAAPPAGWTPVRVGLALAWGMVLLALVVALLGVRGLLELNRHRLEFVSAVTHELRTPLTTFQMYTDMLAGGMVSDPDKVAAYHQTLHGESLRLSHMVQNVLEYARLEDRRWRPTCERVDPRALVDRLGEQLTSRCARAGVALQVDDQLGDGVQVSTDPEAVERILVNLIDNACKYGAATHGAPGAESGEARVTLQLYPRGAEVVMAVVDRGPGLPAADIERVFGAFSRLARDEGAPTPGVGLGLALARRWARQLGGDLRALPGPGGRFELILPRAG